MISGVTALVVLLSAAALVGGYPHRQMAMATEGMGERAGGPNRFYHEVLPDASWRTIVRPSPDLVYSALAYDLRTGPLVIELPGHDDYWVLQFVADNTDSWAYVGSRTHGRAPVHIALAHGDQALPAGMDGYRSPSPTGALILRYLVRGKDEFREIDRKRRTIKVVGAVE